MLAYQRESEVILSNVEGRSYRDDLRNRTGRLSESAENRVSIDLSAGTNRFGSRTGADSIEELNF